MNFRSDKDDKRDDPSLCEALPLCPICDGRMETVYARAHQQVCQCVDCACTLTVPAGAWQIAAGKGRDSPAA
jgi:hypothetical protein